MASLGSLVLDLEARTSPFDKALRKSESRLESLGSAFQHAQRKAGRMFSALKTGDFGKLGGELNSMLKPALVSVAGGFISLASAAAKATAAITVAAAAAATAFVASSVKSAAAMETTRTSFKVMLGDAEKADKLLKELFDFSKVTPFTPDKVFGAGKGLLAAGFDQSEVIENVRLLGDVAAGSTSELADIVEIYGRIQLKGKASLEEINRLTDRNIPILKELEKQLGKSGDELFKMISAGKVGFPEIRAAMQSMTAEGGIFFKAMEEQSKTLNGLWSTLTGNFEAGKVELGSAFIESTNLKGVLEDLNTVVKKLDWKAMGEEAATAFKMMLEFAEPLGRAMIAMMQGVAGFSALRAQRLDIESAINARLGRTELAEQQSEAAAQLRISAGERTLRAMRLTRSLDEGLARISSGEPKETVDKPKPVEDALTDPYGQLEVEVIDGPSKADIERNTQAVMNGTAGIEAAVRALEVKIDSMDLLQVAKPT